MVRWVESTDRIAEPWDRVGGSARVGIDVGGTFTDLTLQDLATNELHVAKVLSTKPDAAVGALTGIEQLLSNAGKAARSVEYLAHASTVASNLVLERNGPRVALLATRGFRDVLLLQRQKRADLYDVNYDKPEPLVRRRDIHEVAERILANGDVLRPLDEEHARRVIEQILASGVDTLAVALLHAYANPVHERRLREIALLARPGLHISLSSDVCPQWREYERSSTTVMNAYVMPAVARYIESMETQLRRLGVGVPIQIMQCSGGLVGTEGIRAEPVHLIESGPAAGALMAGIVGRLSGRDSVLAFDMGGTTAKVSLIVGGEPVLVEEFEVAPVTKQHAGSGLPVLVPAVDLIEIGTGGGSIAGLDTGVLRVGPESAGASPGPACYGLGGIRPTVTDADLVLGYLDPAYFLGGRLRLDVDAARRAIAEGVADPLGIGVEDAAHAIFAVANASMANAMRVATVQKGVDPRGFTAVGFGGAGPVHAASICQDIGIRELIIPANAGVGSALGLLVARVKFEFGRTLKFRLTEETLPRLEAALEELEQRGRQALVQSNALAGSTLVRRVRMRYVGQGYEIPVHVPAGRLGGEALDAMRESFFASYRHLYGMRPAAGDLEVVSCRMTALGPELGAGIPRLAGDRAAAAGPAGRRRAYFHALGGFTEVDVWSRYGLEEGRSVEGPAIIQERESTTVLPPGCSARLDSLRNLVVTIGAPPR